MSKRWMVTALGLCATACGNGGADKGIPPQKVADAVHAVLEADRAVYAREVVQRLQNQEGVIKASEHFRDDRALPLPAQMFRMGAESARRAQTGLTYALLSPWPLNKQNAPRTEAEQVGLRHAVERGQPTYATETLGGVRYFTAVYPDKAVSEACVSCHNEHRDSPKRDFKVGDTMGGVVIRIALE